MGGLALLLGVVVLIATKDFPGAAANRPGPAFLPRILSVLFAVSGLVLLFCQKSPSEEPAEESQELSTDAALGTCWDIAFLIGALALFVAVLDTVGFLIAATVLSTAVFLRMRNGLVTSALATLILVAGTYTLFGIILGVMLPRGWLGW